MYARVTKACETFSLRSIHAHSNCNWMAFKASITIGILFLDFQHFSTHFWSLPGSRKPWGNIHSVYIYESAKKKNGIALPLVFIFPNKVVRPECRKNLKFLVLIYSLPLYSSFFASLVFHFFTTHTYTQVFFFFLSVCKFCAYFVADLYVCLIFAFNLI